MRTDLEAIRDRVISRVLAAHRISKRDLLGECRDSDLVMARKAIAHSLRAERFSVRHIGRILHRDRSTIEHYLGMRVDVSMVLPNSINCFPTEVQDAITAAARSQRMTPAVIVAEWITERALFEASKTMEKAA
ncbi:hypothetical protein [Bradyrhizobium sp. LA2.1]|uniref:hypothetical protein n=1 Tax=Bradyrhizobium sp. LA2.1 TaxID=3156376 RepID=UPI003393E07D